jgi:hypothetical protein
MFDAIAIHRYRASFVEFKTKDKEHVLTQFLLASLQAQRVMAEYTTHEFLHHPSIAPIINYHLYCHRVPWSVFNKLEAEVATVSNLAKVAQREADRSTTAGRCGGRGGRGGGGGDE